MKAKDLYVGGFFRLHDDEDDVGMFLLVTEISKDSEGVIKFKASGVGSVGGREWANQYGRGIKDCFVDYEFEAEMKESKEVDWKGFKYWELVKNYSSITEAQVNEKLDSIG